MQHYRTLTSWTPSITSHSFPCVTYNGLETMSHIFSGCLTNHWLFKYSSEVRNQHAMAAVANLERNPSDSLLSIIWRSDLQTHGTLQSIAELLPCGKSKLLPYHTVFLSQLTPKKSPQKRGWTWSSNDFSLKKKTSWFKRPWDYPKATYMMFKRRTNWMSFLPQRYRKNETKNRPQDPTFFARRWILENHPAIHKLQGH